MPVELLGAVRTVAQVGRQNHFRVADGLKGKASAFQLGAKFRSVVDLPVVGDGHLLSLIGEAHRLAAVFRIDHRKAGVSQSAVSGQMRPLVVGTAVGDAPCHAPGKIEPVLGGPNQPLLIVGKSRKTTHTKNPFHKYS